MEVAIAAFLAIIAFFQFESNKTLESIEKARISPRLSIAAASEKIRFDNNSDASFPERILVSETSGYSDVSHVLAESAFMSSSFNCGLRIESLYTWDRSQRAAIATDGAKNFAKFLREYNGSVGNIYMLTTLRVFILDPWERGIRRDYIVWNLGNVESVPTGFAPGQPDVIVWAQVHYEDESLLLVVLPNQTLGRGCQEFLKTMDELPGLGVTTAMALPLGP